MNKKELINTLKDLEEHCRSMINEEEPECIWIRNVNALNITVEKFLSEFEGEEAQDTIRKILSRENLSQKQLADIVGNTRQNINQMLTRGVSMKYSNFQKLINALGYEVICRKKNSDNRSITLDKLSFA